MLKIELWTSLLDSEKKWESPKNFEELCHRGCTEEGLDAKYPDPGVTKPNLHYLTLHGTRGKVYFGGVGGGGMGSLWGGGLRVHSVTLAGVN